MMVLDKKENEKIAEKIISEQKALDELYKDEEDLKSVEKFIDYNADGTAFVNIHALGDPNVFSPFLAKDIKKDYIEAMSAGDEGKKQEIAREIFKDEPEKLLGIITDKIKLAEQFCDVIPLYYDDAGVFWRFDSKERYWYIVDEIDILNWVRNSAVQNITSSKERTELVNALKQEARRRKPIDLPKFCIQFRREIVNIETGGRTPATHKIFCTNPIPWRIGKSPDTPILDKLFSEWVGEKDVKKLYEILAYCMLPDYPIERFFVLYGSGSNGKSVFRQILRKFIGDKNCVSTSLETLTQSRFESAKMYKKLVCEMGETNITKIDGTDKLKRAVSGKDLLGAEWKNKGLKDFVNYAKIIISTNNVPPTDDKTDGFYRKTLIIDFPNQFTKEIDIMATIPDLEYENLACKSIGILLDLLERRAFYEEGDFHARREKYEAHSNPFLKFWKEFIDEDDPNADITKSEFARRLNEWLKENKHREMSEATVGKLMKEKGVVESRIMKPMYDNITNEFVNKQIRVWGGIKWKEAKK